jgi:hypothetical protein
MTLSPEVLAIGADAASIPSSADRRGQVVADPVAADGDAVLDATLELDAEVEALPHEAEEGDPDDDGGDGVPEPPLADEVDRDGAVVQLLAEAGHLAHRAAPPVVAGRLSPAM